MMEDIVVRNLPVDKENLAFEGWNIEYEKSHILKSMCKNGKDKTCEREDPCELCTYSYALELPHLPDMVFHKNRLTLLHQNGALLDFNPMEALRFVDNGKQPLQVACAQEWKESRPNCHMEEKFKPFDWTFTTTYQGTMNEKIRTEPTTQQLNKFKLMQREKILFYHDLTLYEDELHDHGISSCSVKIRVMPSGFYILLRHFLRVDDVLIKMHDTRFHYEIENDYIFKEYTKREATYDELKSVPPALYTIPNEIENFLPIKMKESSKLFFK
ncbi:TIP41-like protein [Teleopsis dalmanni]|uniref:TIP41-like protein n=1 Tax=Teleopsis dalmanni TaxID=139649 RepID=UPI0018CF6F48|nr:TIP41-like protein [Teleopsis dalmanni]